MFVLGVLEFPMPRLGLTAPVAVVPTMAFVGRVTAGRWVASCFIGAVVDGTLDAVRFVAARSRAPRLAAAYSHDVI